MKKWEVSLDMSLAGIGECKEHEGVLLRGGAMEMYWLVGQALHLVGWD